MSLKTWLHKRLPLKLIFGKNFQVPRNLNIWYLFGALAIFALVLQFVSGLWLTMFYQPSAEKAFASIQYIMRDVPYGWLLRYAHTTGASALFIILYLHIFRALLYRSYSAPRELVWLLGVILLWLMMLEAFLGYLLPWGQMSFWGATVITNLLTVIPGGEYLVVWLRGDYQISGVTLNRFYALHVVALPILLIWLIQLHVKALHHVGSGNPQNLPIDTRIPNKDCVPFFPHYFLKDFVAIVIFLIIYLAVLFFLPHGFGLLLDPLNQLPANALQTPIDIKPLWYLAPFYVILRAIPDKNWGVALMTFSLFLWGFLPWLSALLRRGRADKIIFSWYQRIGLILFAFSFVMLIILGLQPVNIYTSTFSVIATIAYFVFLLCCLI